MGSKILAINPGSTSTKVALYDDEHPLLELTLRHSAEEIARFDDIISQLDWRREIILSALREQHFDIRELAVVIGRGGLVNLPAGEPVFFPQRPSDPLHHRGPVARQGP